MADRTPFVTSVFHPTDFSDASDRAFAHALAVALVRQTKLTILHVGGDGDWSRFPSVRRTLERWGFLAPNSPRSAVFDNLKLRVQKIDLKGSRPAPEAITDFLTSQPHDLIVLSTEGREGLPRWFHRSSAEQIAEHANTMTLFVPEAAPGFISLETGDLAIERILIPVATDPSPAHALEYARRVIDGGGSETTTVRMVHVGDRSTMPPLDTPADASGIWETECLDGDVLDAIGGAMDAFRPDLLIMPTAGQHGFLDALRGSVTQQILRRATCPLLAVPPRPTGAIQG